jgi:hypothetical protein
MKKINYFFTLFCVALILGSCGINKAPFQDYPVTTEVQLNQANYRIIGTAEGYSRQLYVFGIGGLSQRSLKQNAIMDMYENANLKGSQAIVNITTALTWEGFIPFFEVKRASARGTIIEFLQDNGEPIRGIESPYNTAPQRTIQPEAKNEDKNTQNVVDVPEMSNSKLEKSEQKKLSDMQAKKDMAYIAYLWKAGTFRQQDRNEISAKYNIEEIKSLYNNYTIEELKEMSDGYNKELRKYKLYK